MFLTLAAAVVAAGQSFTCTPTHVWDGDGPIWCAKGPHIRISGIAAREMDGTCRTNQPCPPATALEAVSYTHLNLKQCRATARAAGTLPR